MALHADKIEALRLRIRLVTGRRVWFTAWGRNYPDIKSARTTHADLNLLAKRPHISAQHHSMIELTDSAQ